MTEDQLIQHVFGLIVGVEGGYDCDPNDRGNYGANGKLIGTNWGIDAASNPDITSVEQMKALTLADAAQRFACKYWTPFQCQTFPPALALLVADAAYNGGHPLQWLQAAVGTGADGDIGPATRAAIAKAFSDAESAGSALDSFQSSHLAYLSALPQWTLYGASNGQAHGWSKRLFLMHRSAIALLSETAPTAPVAANANTGTNAAAKAA